MAALPAAVGGGSALLAGSGSRLAAERRLLIRSIASTAARAGDRDGMRELTDQAASIAGPPGPGAVA